MVVISGMAGLSDQRIRAEVSSYCVDFTRTEAVVNFYEGTRSDF